MMRVLTLQSFLLCLMFIHAQQRPAPPVTIHGRLNGERLSPFEPIVLTLHIRNKSSRTVALGCGFKDPFNAENKRAGAGIVIRLKLRKVLSKENDAFWKKIEWTVWTSRPAENSPPFFLLPPGEYIVLRILLTDKIWVNKEEIPQDYVLTAVAEHLCSDNSVEQQYGDYCTKNGAIQWLDKAGAIQTRFRVVAPQNAAEQDLYARLKEPSTGGGMVGSGRFWLLHNNDEQSKQLFAALKETRFADTLWVMLNQAVLQHRLIYPRGLRGNQKNLPWLLRQLQHMEKRYLNDEVFQPVLKQLAWWKILALYALGREAEAEALKQSIIAKEPNRCFFLELQWLKNTIKDPKENLQGDEKEQNNSTQPATSEPEHPTPKKESSATENHGVTAVQTDLHPEQETETAEKRRPRSERGVGVAERRPPVVQRLDNFWLWLILLGCAAVFVFILLSRRR